MAAFWRALTQGGEFPALGHVALQVPALYGDQVLVDGGSWPRPMTGGWPSTSGPSTTRRKWPDCSTWASTGSSRTGPRPWWRCWTNGTPPGAPESSGAEAQPRPALGRLPWLAFFLALILSLLVRFDISDEVSSAGDTDHHRAPVASRPMERLGLVGLPNAGKTSLFNALTGASAAVAPHPFTTTESSVSIAPLPDPRLDALAAMSASKKVVHAGMEVVDIAGLVPGASTGEGLGNRFLAGIREVDALCLVLRAFESDEAPGDTDPVEALATLELELVLADVGTIEAQIEKRRKAARLDKSLVAEVAAMEEAHEVLSGGVPLYRSGLDAETRGLLENFFLLTDKSVLAVVNLGEDQLDEGRGHRRPGGRRTGRPW